MPDFEQRPRGVGSELYYFSPSPHNHPHFKPWQLQLPKLVLDGRNKRTDNPDVVMTTRDSKGGNLTSEASTPEDDLFLPFLMRESRPLNSHLRLWLDFLGSEGKTLLTSSFYVNVATAVTVHKAFVSSPARTRLEGFLTTPLKTGQCLQSALSVSLLGRMDNPRDLLSTHPILTKVTVRNLRTPLRSCLGSK